MDERLPESSANARSRWRFSLRAMFVAFTVASLVVGYRLDLVRRQREAMVELNALGAMQQVYGAQSTREFKPISWFDGLSGRDGVAFLRIEGNAFGDATTHHLEALSVEHAIVVDTVFTEAGLRFLHRWPDLTFLHLSGRNITDAVLARYVRNPTSVRNLSLEGPITDLGLKESISSMVELQVLALAETKCTPRGLLQLRTLKSLAYLALARDKQNWRVFSKLDEVPSIDVRDIELADLIEYLTDFHQVKLSFDKDSVEAQLASIPDWPTRLITAKINGGTLNGALDSVLKPRGLGHVVHDGGIWITSRANLAAYDTLLDELERAHPGAAIHMDWQPEP